MPITYDIDHARRTVFAIASGVLTPNDLFSYQKEVWVRPEFRQFNECVDMSEVTEVVDANEGNMQMLAALAVQGDDPTLPTKLAIIAGESLHYGLARMYETYRSMQPENARKVGIFHTRGEALHWLAERTAP
jgi:hypothetical protein